MSSSLKVADILLTWFIFGATSGVPLEPLVALFALTDSLAPSDPPPKPARSILALACWGAVGASPAAAAVATAVSVVGVLVGAGVSSLYGCLASTTGAVFLLLYASFTIAKSPVDSSIP